MIQLVLINEYERKDRSPMINANESDRKKLAPLFDGIWDSMVIAYLQGYMGDCYVNKLPDPDYGMIVSGEYSFYGGKAEMAEPLLSHLFDYIHGNKSVAIYADLKWRDALLEYPQNHPKEVMRHGIVQKDYVFDEEKLKQMSGNLPPGYELKPFDKDLYEQSTKAEWSQEFVECFDSAEEFLERGFGYGIVKDGELVAGATTQTVYDGGAETQLATREDQRGQGLAKAVAAAFVLEGQRRGTRICWDAANLTSLHIATSIGFESAGDYSTVHIRR